MGSWARTLPLSLNLYLKHFHILSSLSHAYEDHDFHKMCFEVFILVFLSCAYDYLELRDGSTLNAGLISRLCGNTLPSTQHSTGSSMLLRFRTDTSVTHKGFKAKYSTGRQITVITNNLKMVFQIQRLVFKCKLKLRHSWPRPSKQKAYINTQVQTLQATQCQFQAFLCLEILYVVL